MPPKRNRRSNRRRRGNSKFNRGTFRFRTTIPNASTVKLNASSLNLNVDASFRPLYINIQVYSTKPSLLQITVFESTLSNAKLKIIEKLVGPNPIRIRIRWPRTYDMLSPNERNQSLIQIDNICLDKSVTDNTAILCGDIGMLYSAETYTEACRLVASPTPLETSFENLAI